jgi:peptidoglycan hydrolase-like protein with peptidoglycan-binding domain
MQSDEPATRRRWVLPTTVVVVLLLAVGAVGAVVWHNRGVDTTTTSDTATTRTATVEKRTLKDTETVDGTLGFAHATTVPAVAQGTVTRLPDEGSVVRQGQALYRIDEQPTFLFYGSIPLYRPLSDGAKGRDVKQLERDLKALGFTPKGMKINRTFDSDTTTAVKRFQKKHGFTQTGVVTADEVVFLPGAVRVGQHTAEVGSRVAPGAPVYAGTATARVVNIALNPNLSSLAHVGERVSVELPDGSRVNGRITDKGAATTTAQGGSAVPVTVGFTTATAKKLRTWESASVSVDLTREIHKDVLTVPVTALVALAEGGYAVYVPDDTAAGHHLVAVTPGLYASGYVEIDSTLAEGDTVEVPATQ